ncbi:MAG: hypothetical protein K6T29_01135 [Peptococcaceae bacterium]|nr:hypothetical protein [Peptococcaceae bacterium]
MAKAGLDQAQKKYGRFSQLLVSIDFHAANSLWELQLMVDISFGAA